MQLAGFVEEFEPYTYDECGVCCDPIGCCDTVGGCGDACRSDCYPPSLVWAEAEYLHWWVDGFSAPQLVTTGPNTADQDDAGVLGQPGTTVLNGGGDYADSGRSMARITLGQWFDPCRTYGIQGGFFGFSDETDRFSAESDGDPILARPFNNVQAGAEGPDARLVAFPNLYSGSISVHAQSSFEGAEVLFRKQLLQGCGLRFDVVTGWKYTSLDETLQINEFRTAESTATGMVEGTTMESFDRFRAENRFHGAQIGFLGTQCNCGWRLDYAMKLGLGVTNSQVTIDGQTTTTTPDPGNPPQVDVAQTGFLTQGTNIGLAEQDQFTVIPELSVRLSHQIGPCTSVSLGYTFMYWSRVARPGDQIDSHLNLTQNTGALVGAPLPEAPWKISDVVIHGLSVGLTHNF